MPLTWLWPEFDEATKGEATGEVVNLYPHRSQVPRQTWLDLVLRARRRIEFLTYASLFLPEENPEAIDILKYKAGSGVSIKLALGDPASPEVALRGREEGMPEGIPGRVRMALAYYRPLVGAPGVTFHLHRTTLYNSIYRFDDDMMVNQHAYGTYGYMAPILHLRRVDGGELFGLYERSFELAWQESFPYEPAR
jgi:hypothetical protein